MRMSDSFTVYTVLSLVACFGVALLLAWLLYRKTEHLDQRLRSGLFAIRTIILGMLGCLLVFPLIRSVSYNLEKPVILIAQDNSMSAGNIEPATFNKQQYETDLRNLAKQLEESYEVKVYNFSDVVKPGFDFSYKGKLTNASQLISQLNDAYLNRNVGAVILATDGIFNRGGTPLYDVNKLKAPVYTIALGDSVARKDLLIASINYNDLVYLDNEFILSVQVQAFESKGALTTLSVLDNGRHVFEEQLQINENAFVKNIQVKLKASKLGVQKYTVSLSPLAHEVSEKNNTQSIFIEVIDARQKILIAAAAPHPDISALKQAISQDKNYEVKIALADDLNAVNINDYGLVILYQLPSANYDATGFLNKLQVSKTSLWYVLGAQSNFNAFNQIQKEVHVGNAGAMLQETYSHVNKGFTAFNLDQQAVKQIEAYDPLLMPFAKIQSNGSAMVVLNQRIGKIDTENPQLFFMSANGRKIGYLIGEGLWRWKLSEAETQKEANIFNDLMAKSIQYLSVKDDKRKFKVYATKNAFDENEPILINAVLYSDSYLPVNTPDVAIQIKSEEGKTYNFLASRTENAYQLNAGALPAGSYSYVASVTLGTQKHTAKGMFYIHAMIAEYQQTVANHQLLNAISKQTNAVMYMPQDISRLAEAIKSNDQIKTISYEDRKYQELINFKWLFALIMILLTIEWFFRKRNGEI
jgi:hypothetical protein